MFQVKVGAVTCQVIAGMEKEKKLKIDCGGDEKKLVGQKVRIEHWGTYVVLCEVQVFGESLLELSKIIFVKKKFAVLTTCFYPL